MKNSLVSVFFLATISFSPVKPDSQKPIGHPKTGNLIIITIDGFRWQEIFTGADSALIHDEQYTPDAATIQSIYWNRSAEERRERLMPFFWNVIAVKGQLYGNRFYDNKVNVANNYAISYPGYNEMFTGDTDIFISSNKKYNNPNTNVLEWLNQKKEFEGQIAAFTSWNVFPFILNEKRSSIPVNSGYENLSIETPSSFMINSVQDKAITHKKPTRYDQLTFIAAKEYLQEHQPRLFYLGLGETDEFAHNGRYDLYLQQANANDRMIAELWHWVQTTPGYKDNTTFIITTDHGRGSKKRRWNSHGSWIRGSSEAWLAVIGPGIESLGERKNDQQMYLQQLAATIAAFFGEKFEPGHVVANAITLPANRSTNNDQRSTTSDDR